MVRRCLSFLIVSVNVQVRTQQRLRVAVVAHPEMDHSKVGYKDRVTFVEAEGFLQIHSCARKVTSGHLQPCDGVQRANQFESSVSISRIGAEILPQPLEGFRGKLTGFRRRSSRCGGRCGSADHASQAPALWRFRGWRKILALDLPDTRFRQALNAAARLIFNFFTFNPRFLDKQHVAIGEVDHVGGQPLNRRAENEKEENAA